MFWLPEPDPYEKYTQGESLMLQRLEIILQISHRPLR